MSSSFQNTEFIERATDRYQKHKTVEKMTELESAGTRAWLEHELDSRSRSVDIYGRTFQFRPIGTTTVTDIVERASTLDDDEDVGQMPKLFRDICAVLGEHCQDDEMDAEAFGQIPPDDVQEIFEEIAISDVDQERIERFREE